MFVAIKVLLIIVCRYPMVLLRISYIFIHNIKYTS